MIKRLLFAFFILSLPMNGSAQNTSSTNGQVGQSAGYASRDATVLSMMGWGVGLAAGIAALCALVHNETAHSH
ncbi:MAG: hypothetical protein Q8L98_04150 [Chlamydiales bacterium]|nr:hypothetical protein [Chlamydiales bacterium]